MEFKEGDRVVVIDYPDDSVEIGSTGTVRCFDAPYWRVRLDTADDDDWGSLLEDFEIELIHKEQPYDPTQMGDTDEDI
jgi:hypothetical protein